MNSGTKKTFKKKFRRGLYRLLTTLNNYDFAKLRPLLLLIIFVFMALALSKLPTTEASGIADTTSALGSTLSTRLRSFQSLETCSEAPVDVVALFLPQNAVSTEDYLAELSDGTMYSFYLTGTELSYLAEGFAATKNQDTLLYLDGLNITYHKNRLPFGKVTSLTLPDGTTPQNNDLYHVISTESIFSLFHYISYRSLGIMEIYPKDETGELLSDYREIMHTADGTVLTVSAALETSVAARTAAAAPSVITMQSGFNLIDLVRSPNKLTLCIMALLLSLCLLIGYMLPRMRRIRIWFRIYCIRRKKRSTHTLYIKKRFRGI